ncbi:hypothetical protein [Sphingobacterium sp. SYP-B4668]|uniref:hypothetical protein n=1 Tax=Sphingobacterium sp. SYP-B4668 TaxID=2996035 RepID=UPI0022DE26FC|nr:hypothetical protein [Sphingobacterium sp. SYP-B4668]
MRYFVILLMLLGLFSCQQHAKKTEHQASTTDTITHRVADTTALITFGFINAAGSQLLTLEQDSLDSPQDYTYLIHADGGEQDISYLHLQQANEQDNGRQTAENFKNSRGYLYQIALPTVPTEAVAVTLVNRAFLNNHKTLSIQPPHSSDNIPDYIQQLSEEKDRKIKKHKNLAQLANQGTITLVEFEVKDSTALAVLIYRSPEKIITKEFPAKYDEISTWRVDDGGEFDMDYFQILNVFSNGENIELVTADFGAEGYVLQYLKEKDGKFVLDKEAYGYSAPL